MCRRIAVVEWSLAERFAPLSLRTGNSERTTVRLHRVIDECQRARFAYRRNNQLTSVRTILTRMQVATGK